MQHRARNYFSVRTRVEDQAHAGSGIFLIVFSPYNTPYTIRTTEFIEQSLSDKVYKERERIDVNRLPMLTLHRSTHCAKQIPLLQPHLQNWDTRREKDRACNLDISLRSSMSSTAKVLQLNGFGFPFATCPNVCGAVRPIHTTYQHYPDIEDTWRCFQFCMRYVRFDVLFRQSEENYRSCKVTGKSH